RAFSYIKLVGTVEGQACRIAETSIDTNRVGCAYVSRQTSQCRHLPVHGNLSNSAISPVGNVNAARAINRNPARTVESRDASNAICAAGASGQPRDSAHESIWSAFSDRMVALVCGINVAHTINCHGVRSEEAGQTPKSICAADER